MSRLLRFDLRARRISEQSAYPQESARVFSTRPYPLQVIESINVSMSLDGAQLYAWPLDEMNADLTLGLVELRALLTLYANWPPEAMDGVISLDAIELRQLLRAYANWPAESIDTAIALNSATLAAILRTYTNWPAEGINAALTLDGATLT